MIFSYHPRRDVRPAVRSMGINENLLITAHIAGGTQYEAKYILEILRENLNRFTRNDFPLRNQVDKKLGF